MKFTRTQFESSSELVITVASVRGIIPTEDAQDTEIESHILAAQSRFETYTGHHLGLRTVTLDCRRESYDDPVNPIIFNVGPVNEITSVEMRPLFKGDYATTTLTDSDYYLDNISLLISRKHLYNHWEVIQIVCTTGYDDVVKVPDDIKRSLIQYVGSGHLNREGNVPLPPNVLQVWNSYAKRRIG